MRFETAILIAAAFFVAGYVLSALVGGFDFTSSSSRVRPAAAQMPQPPAGNDYLDLLVEKTVNDPGSAAAWTALGNAYFDVGRHLEAIDAYRRSLDLDPQNPDVWTDMGIMYRRTNRPQEAIAAFDRAAEADPRHPMCRFNKGIVLYYDLGNEAGAVAAWEEVKAIDPGFVAPNGQTITQILDGLD